MGFDKKEYNRNRHYKIRYGITIKDYNRMHSEQGGKCGICESKETGVKRTDNFNVDHCHKSGAVRGLLCHNCNLALGKFNDDVKYIKAIINYLKKHE